MLYKIRRRITVTLSIFIFSTWFFAQIVENHRGRLSIPFLGPRDIYSKSYDENQILVEVGLRARGSDAQIVPSWRTLDGKLSNPRARCMNFFLENLRNVARARCAGAVRQFPTGQLDSILWYVSGYMYLLNLVITFSTRSTAVCTYCSISRYMVQYCLFA